MPTQEGVLNTTTSHTGVGNGTAANSTGAPSAGDSDG